MTSPALRFPSRDWSPQPVPLPPNPLPALALLLSILGCWVFWTVGYLSGRTAERGSQLGQVLALQPRAAALDSALTWARGLQARLDALPKPTPPRTAPRRVAPATLAPQRPEMAPQKFPSP